jgi:ribosomal protein S18 acetylase RimI-like enzyme
MTVTLSRPYEGDRDLRLMQDLASECWRLRGPLVTAHVGDLAWWMYQHPNKLEEVRIELWLEDGTCVAWAWLSRKDGGLYFQVHPERPELVAAVVAWADARSVWALSSDTQAIQEVEAAGYERSDSRAYEHHVRALDGPIELPPLPAGFSLGRVRGEADLERRVEVHRSAFEPSRVQVESYRRVTRAWPYRPELDHVVEAPDGSLAAFCLCWLDERNGVGLFEPVGTHQEHRRLGLASAVCLAAQQSLQALGATRAVVLSSAGSAASELYEKLGMHSIARHLEFRRHSTST